VKTDNRMRFTNDNLEAIIILKSNLDLWNSVHVQNIMNKKSEKENNQQATINNNSEDAIGNYESQYNTNDDNNANNVTLLDIDDSDTEMDNVVQVTLFDNNVDNIDVDVVSSDEFAYEDSEIDPAVNTNNN